MQLKNILVWYIIYQKEKKFNMRRMKLQGCFMNLSKQLHLL